MSNKTSNSRTIRPAIVTPVTTTMCVTFPPPALCSSHPAGPDQDLSINKYIDVFSEVRLTKFTLQHRKATTGTPIPERPRRNQAQVKFVTHVLAEKPAPQHIVLKIG